MATTLKNLTATEVIAMFKGLNLPVTDDAQRIEEKAKELRDYYLRMRNSTEPHRRHQAGVWFQNLTLLQANRAALIDIVYNFFAQLADASLEAILSAKVKATLSQELYVQWERFALEQCQCDPALARRFVEDYRQKKGVKPSDPFPRLVEQLTAVSTPAQITLHWQFPAQECDEIILKRYGLTKKGEFRKRGETLCQGRLSSYIDRDVEAGERYRYEVFSVWKETESKTAVPVDTWAIGEISGVERRWVQDHVWLHWRKPADDCQVQLFRAPTPLAPVQRGVPDPLPENPEARLIYSGPASEWRDYDAQPGQEYYYLLVAVFAPGHFADGVTISIRAPYPPPAVSASQATYVDGAVHIRWQPVNDERPVEYVVTRRDGGTPPGNVTDGYTVGITRDTHILDNETATGRRYTYAVFSRAEEIMATGAVTAPIDTLAEVSQLYAGIGDGTVELHWQTPANVSRMIVRRDVKPLTDHTDGQAVSLTGAGHAKDTGLQNGRTYHYLVCCAYRPADADERITPGLRIEVTPEPPPEMVSDLNVQVDGQELVFAWTPPKQGKAILLRSAEPLKLQPGQRLSAEELDRLGERIITADGHSRDTHPDVQKPYYNMFTIAGPQAIAGHAVCGVVVADVANLSLSVARDGVVLRWGWPPGCHTAVIARRQDVPAAGPDDPYATGARYTRLEYLNAGGKFVDKVQEGRWLFHYTVYAQASGAPGQFFAPGVSAAIQWAPWMTLTYRLATATEAPHQGQALRLTWRVQDALPDFAGFAFIASESGPPESLDDGVELFRWQPGEKVIDEEYQAWVSLAPVQQRRWPRFFGKVIVLDPRQRHTTLIVYPNTCAPLSSQGETENGERGESAAVYQPGTPEMVICPHCFAEFPVDKILFDLYDGGELKAASYSRLDRLLKRPLRPPKNKQGQLLTRKRCPYYTETDPHILPFTAGTQPSLVIGVIGAKFSGKSHFIATLIQRLGGQVAFDFQADLQPVTIETSQRYEQEFYNPLFGRNLELPVTLGAPPPLIYDLYLSGQPWGEKQDRAVTLALYDTAGENFDDPATVKQMVRYLRVASGILFLIDPLQSPIVRDTLPSYVPLPDIALMAEPHTVISRVLTELENGKIIAQSGRLATPVAVVLTKCDVLRDAGLIEANRLWSTDKRHVAFFNRQAHEDMSGMMEEQMLRWNQRAYNTVKARFSHHAFFGVSATGCASDKETHRYKYISPWRVEDPLLWLLAELGVISAQ